MARLRRGPYERGARLGLLAALSIGGALASASSCSSVTEVVVVVDGDVTDVDTIALRVEGVSGVVADRRVDFRDGAALPLTLGVQAGTDERGPFVVRAEAWRGDDVVVSRVARSRLVPGESRVLVVSLCRACDGTECAAATTCAPDGACEAVASELDLPRWTGSAPRHACGASAADAGDGGGGEDAGLEASVLPGGYHELTDARLWSTVDLSKTVDPSLKGYVGAAFDGRYLYLSPWAYGGAAHGNVARFDTTLPFEDEASWTSFDVSSVDPRAKGFAGAAVFDKKLLYLVPFQNPVGTPSGLVARFDTNQAFGAASAWSFIALTANATTPNTGGHGGAVLSKSHVWLPSRTTARSIALHDVRQPALDAGWEAYDTQTKLDAGAGKATGYYGGAFAGDKLYFAPFDDGAGPHGIAIRHGIGGLELNWSAFDLTTLSLAWRGFAGIVFDGKRYLYYVPYENARGVRHGNVVRFDTLGGFADPASWRGVDVSAFDARLKGFIGGVFDGRFVYLVPFDDTAGVVVTRYDTLGDFAAASSWTTFDARTLPGGAQRFNGGAFDGKYVYFVPYADGPVVRFDARDTPVPLNTANGSFL